LKYESTLVSLKFEICTQHEEKKEEKERREVQ
jgi:hypothetical protein